MNDLFGPEPESGPSYVDGFLPMPAMPSSDTTPTAGFRHTDRRASSVPEFTEEQRRQLWALIRNAASQPTASQVTDVQALIDQFVAKVHDGAIVSPAKEAAPSSQAILVVHDNRVALSTQRQPKANPPPAGAKINHSRDKTTQNRITQYDWYDKFPVRENWVARAGEVPFVIKYSKQGELKPTIKFGRHTLEAYIRGCAARGIPLRLWIQNAATMHADRFPSRASHLCRAADCPVRNGTIGRGMYQVCFDEYPTDTSSGRYDPFFVAGYMHLFCLEEMIPMAEIMGFADVQPDTRDLPLEQRNPMSLDRDGHNGRALTGAYREWKSMHVDRYVRSGVAPPPPRAPRRSNDCLYKYLTVKKMEAQPVTRQRMRDQRNGYDISKHCGNLRKLATHKAEARRKRKLARFGSGDDDAAAAAAQTEVDDDGNAEGEPKVADVVFVSSTGAAFKRTRLHSSALTSASVPILDTDRADAPSLAVSTSLATSMSNALPTVKPTLEGLDLTGASENEAMSLFSDAYGTLMAEEDSYALYSSYGPYASRTPNTAASYVPYMGGSPLSPYRLRDTQARRDSAFRHHAMALADAQVSANAPDMRRLGIDVTVLDTDNIPMDPALTETEATETVEMAKTAKTAKTGLAHAGPGADPESPSRRVTRSMSRHASYTVTDPSAALDFDFNSLDRLNGLDGLEAYDEVDYEALVAGASFLDDLHGAYPTL